jgi:hypothetical protein
VEHGVVEKVRLLAHEHEARPNAPGDGRLTRVTDCSWLSSRSIISLKCGSCSVMSSGIHPSMHELPQQVTITATGTSSASCR